MFGRKSEEQFLIDLGLRREKVSTKVAESLDTGRSRDKLKINTELDKDEDLSAVPEEEEKQSTSSDTGSKSITLAKTTNLCYHQEQKITKYGFHLKSLCITRPCIIICERMYNRVHDQIKHFWSQSEMSKKLLAVKLWHNVFWKASESWNITTSL